MKIFTKRYLQICLVLATVLGLSRAYFRLTDDFRVGNIVYEMPFRQDWENKNLPIDEQEHVDQILSQTFSYIGKGAQSYAFVSEDQKYVLKFFKFKHLRPSLLMTWLPPFPPFSTYQVKEELRKSRKREGVFRGYKLAYDVNRQESGLVYVQLNPTHQDKFVTVIDKIGLKRTINLGDIPFVLQTKGQTLRTVMTHLMETGDVDTAKQKIGQIFALYLSEYRKGIYDHDHGVMHNTGFVDDQPFHLDVGKLSPAPEMTQTSEFRKDLIVVANKIDRWLRQQYPEKRDELSSFMEKQIESATGEPFQFSVSQT